MCRTQAISLLISVVRGLRCNHALISQLPGSSKYLGGLQNLQFTAPKKMQTEWFSAHYSHSLQRLLETLIFRPRWRNPLPTSRSLPACSAGALPRSIASPAAAACSRWWPPPSVGLDPSGATPRNAPSSRTSADGSGRNVHGNWAQYVLKGGGGKNLKTLKTGRNHENVM